MKAAKEVGVRRRDVVAASVFTMQSTTSILEKIRDQLEADIPEPADFLLGPGGIQTVFPRSNVAGIVFNRQAGADPAKPAAFVASPIFLLALEFVPGAVAQIAFGK